MLRKSNNNNPFMSMQQAEIYISYAWGKDKSVASQRRQNVFDEVLTMLKTNNFSVTVDFEGIGYKESIHNFMQTLSKGKYIVVIVSDRYLKSESCMFEACEMIGNGNFRERIFPIVLPDAKIYTPTSKQAYLNYWMQKKENQKELFDSIENKEHAQSHLDTLKLYDQIVRNFDKIVAQISDMNTMSLAYHKANNYSTIVNAIKATATTSTTTTVGKMSLVEAYTLLQVTPTSSPNEVHTQFNLLQAENEAGIINASMPEVKQAHIMALQRLKKAFGIVSLKADEYLKQEKNEVRRLLRQKRYIQAKNLLENLQQSEPNDAQIAKLCERCNTILAKEENERPENTQRGAQTNRETPKKSTENYQETQKEIKENTKETSNSGVKMVQTKKMRNEMQMQKKNSGTSKTKIYRKIVLPVSLAILAVILGFVTKERILEHHVESVIQKAQRHVEEGDISSAVRLLEDASRDLVYETRLADELKSFSDLKIEYSKLALKIKSYKSEKNWRRAERGILKLMAITPRDSFLMYQLDDVQREIKKNDFQYWLVSATEAIRQGESGYTKAKDSFAKARAIGVKSKILDVNVRRLDSLIELAYDRHMGKANVFSQSANNKQNAILEYEAALVVKPSDSAAVKQLSELKK